MMKFQYIHFPTLPYDQVRDCFPSHGDVFMRNAYANWMATFNRRSSLLYRSQLNQHARWAQNAFCDRYNITPDEMWSYDEQWGDFRIESGIEQHQREYQRIAGELQSLDRKPKSVPVIELAKELIEQTVAQAAGLEHPLDLEMPMYELWFNSVINNSPEDRRELKYLPYKEYLKTSHWKRVRSAMLLIYSARCANPACLRSTEGSWMGDEVDLEVHHLSYANKGNERFVDLQLLCFNCHEKAHSVVKDEPPPPSQTRNTWQMPDNMEAF